MRTTAPVRIFRNGYEYVRLPSPEGYDAIVIDQRIQFGYPCIRGTRIPAESVAMHYAGGDSVPIIARTYGGLTEAEVQACIDYVNAPLKRASA